MPRLVDFIEQYPQLSEITDVDKLMLGLSRVTGLSLAQIVAQLPEEEQELVLGGADMDALIYDFDFWGRPSQLPPEDDSWNLFAMVGGRGGGKTRAGSEWTHKKALQRPDTRIILVARTAADARDVMIEGDSGIMNVGFPENRPKYESSKRRLTWPNGSMATAYSSEEPDQLRGPQAHYTWADETAAWKHQEDDSGLNAWSNAVIATRLGDNPQVFATTTPKRTPFMFELIEREKTDPGVLISHSSTMDNAGNLSDIYIDNMLSLYEGTRLAEQELYGHMLSEIEGALWDDDLINAARLKASTPTNFPLRVIAVDPSVAEEPKDECGIIVAGATSQARLTDRHAYVLEDFSIQGSPSVWSKQVVKAYQKYRCPVVAEVNQGGALVKAAIHAIDASIPVIEVRAHQGKALRAEPVTLKYDQKRVHHIGYLPELEAQLVSWVPGETKKSPDRIDALVYAIIALIIKPPRLIGGGKIRARSLSDRRLPTFQPKRR